MKHYWNVFVAPLDNTLDRILAFVPRLLVAGVVFLLFYGMARLVRVGVRKSLNRFNHVPWAVQALIGRLIHISLLLTGLLVALSAINVNITALITSLGVAGFALGFALKDILENFLSGILLLFAHPFEVGDQVKLGDYEGVVKDIQLRTTTVQTYTNDLVGIPNSQVFTNAVINHTRSGKRLYHVDFDTSLSADTDTVEQEALRVACEHPDILNDPPATIRLTQVNSANDVLSWRLFFWAAPTKAAEVQTTSAMLRDIKGALYDKGIPTPTGTSAMILRNAQEPGDGKGADHNGHSLSNSGQAVTFTGR